MEEQMSLVSAEEGVQRVSEDAPGTYHDSSEGRSSQLSTPGTMSPVGRPTFLRSLTRGWWLKFFAYLVLFCVSLRSALDFEQPEEVRYRDIINTAIEHPKYTGYGRQEKIFIAAAFSNNQDVLPYWSASLIKVIHYLGTRNVYVSILESGSSDQSPLLLRELDGMLARLHVERRILTEDDVVKKPEDMGGNNRIDFLSAIRNRALEPLIEMGGYDKVVFSNDIFIEPESFIDLIDTMNGDYDMACGLDFGHYGLYDDWVIRDRLGKLPSTIWPYFFEQADYQAIVKEEPVPVFTCWNGIVVFAADPLLPIHLRSNRTLSTDALPYELPATHPAAHNASMRGPSPALTPPIRFRSSAPDECFSSESFLLPYDLRRQFNMQRIYVNPRVITGYQWRYVLPQLAPF
ncbi:glycosyltransferase family 69 protein [Serpula lacrymans var. lacrymans S7.3]|uniref:Glycosyltransferase family 69 protein n=1 Tax=Serpula lacrymans var. lacrymans (strain S7.3) TaxID=936435 RepID=F8PS06_SERL3|nr:glycosyltransferase family 69 protein [Serpula lacrymans var. lacrymans S7.3]